MHADNLGGTQQCPDILRVLNMIEQQQECRFAAFLGERQAVVEIDIRIIAAFQRHTLVIRITQPPVEFASVDALNRHTHFSGNPDNIAERTGFLRTG
jgi:hypothetical protein